MQLDGDGHPIKVVRTSVDVPDPVAVKAVSHTLIDVQEHYRLVTTGVLTACLPSPFDPVAAYIQHNPQDELPRTLTYANRFFNGLPFTRLAGKTVSLNTVLWLVPLHYADSFDHFVSSLILTYEQKRFLARIGHHDLQIVDPFTVAKQRVILKPPLVSVRSFAVASNRAFSYLDSASPLQLPTLKHNPPTPEIVKEADLLFSDDGVDVTATKERRERKW